MNKPHELAHLEHFRQVYPLFPEGEIRETESPDFIVYAGNRLLGIEHTKIFQPGPPHGGSLQAQDSLAQRVVGRARELWTGGPPLLVQVLFNPRVEIAKQRVDTIAEAIAGAVGEADIEPGGLITLKRTPVTRDSFPQEVVFIHVRRPLIDKDEENRWCCSSAGFIPNLTPQHIQNVIDKKEGKLDSYTLKCSEVWLLIVADALRVPATVDLTESALRYCYATQFDRVFFFWNADRRFIELGVSVT